MTFSQATDILNSEPGLVAGAVLATVFIVGVLIQGAAVVVERRQSVRRN